MTINVQVRIHESNYGALIHAIEEELGSNPIEEGLGLFTFTGMRLPTALKIMEYADDPRCEFITLRNT